jgi:hypothetical protein
MLLIIPDMCFSFLHKNKNKNVKFVISQQPEFKFIHFLLKIFSNDPLKSSIEFLKYHENVVTHIKDESINKQQKQNKIDIEKTNEDCLEKILINENHENDIKNILYDNIKNKINNDQMTDEINTMYDNKEINTKLNYVTDSPQTQSLILY